MKHRLHLRGLVGAVVVLVLVRVVLAASWFLTGSMEASRTDFAAVSLNDGRVLACGGAPYNSYPIDECEIYNPATHLWTRTGSMLSARRSFRMVRLPNGHVLAAGGNSTARRPRAAMSSSETFDPATGRWSVAGSMSSARQAFLAILLPDGRVLAAGGSSGSAILTTSDVFNPTTLQWSTTGSMLDARHSFSGVSMSTGSVLVTGGVSFGNFPLSSSELYDPVSGSWSLTGSMADAVSGFGLAIVSNSRAGTTVLRAGGLGVSGALNTAELYDSTSGNWVRVGSMNSARSTLGLSRLTNGNVLASGGSAGSQVLSTAEEYHASTRVWHSVPSMQNARTAFALISLTGNGTALAIGGRTASGGVLNTAELFTP